MKLLLTLLVGVFLANGEVIRYDGHKVYRVHPTTQEINNLLRSMESDPKYNFWKGPGRIGGEVDIMVSSQDQKDFEELMIFNEVDFQVFINDVQYLIDENSMSKSTKAPIDWTQYYNVEAIHAWLDDLAANYSQVETLIPGRTYESRDIKGVKISYGPGRRAIFIEGGAHGREWIAPATVTYIINEILTSTDLKWRNISESYDWYIFPSANPDGYEYTISSDRIWRKNRVPVPDDCFGVDPNRNWNFTWGEFGSTNQSCSNIYKGPAPFSEVETVAMKNVIDSIASRLDLYLTFHSYGKYLLIPYGNTTDHLGYYDDMYTIGIAAARSLEAMYGMNYTVGNMAEILYKASGSSADWVADRHNIPISYVYELRDNENYGFMLPPEQIIPNCEEVMASLVTLFEEGERLGYFNFSVK